MRSLVSWIVVAFQSSVIATTGPTLLRANKRLIVLFYVEADLIKKIEKLKNQPVEWRFSPPVAPCFGGSWERLIKSAKSALRAILNERSVTEDVLHTAIVGAEALLNSRPLTHVSVDPNSLEALTPNHFLLLHAHPGCH